MRYELWLDESGDFRNEQEKKVLHYHPSLVGGILMEHKKVQRLESQLDSLLDAENNHATELTGAQKRSYVLPILETLRDTYGARQFFFENADYEDADTNRQLYLRIIAEGLIQLVQRLNAEKGGVELRILIAHRMDQQASAENRSIENEEYLHALQAVYDRKRKEHRVQLHPDTRICFDVRVANQEQKLQLADFACNTRLTRDSAAFLSVRPRVDALYGDACIFSLNEITSQNYIQLCLAQESIADAVYELYTTRDALDADAVLGQILDRMKNMSYRIIKQQLKECEAQIIGYLAYETDYERGEAFLRRVIEGFAARLGEVTDAYPNLRLSLLLNLSDCFLREGSILEARQTLEEARAVRDTMDKCFENWLPFYQYREKLALYYIDSFAFRQAAEILAEEGEKFRRILDALEYEKSEYFGDCLCMHIYALMFLQRQNPALYPELVRLSDLALTQYPNNEGELERHRQYRSHIELEAGNYENALQWLIRAKCYGSPDISQDRTLLEFLEAVSATEERGSQEYYLMYYLLIIDRAKRAGHAIAGRMNRALKKSALFELVKPQANADGFDEINLEPPAPTNTYHPTEILLWKYASFLRRSGNTAEARELYQKAIRICREQEHYLTMRITGVGILAEYLACFPEERNSRVLLTSQLRYLTEQDLEAPTMEFIRELEMLFKNGRLEEMAERITY